MFLFFNEIKYANWRKMKANTGFRCRVILGFIPHLSLSVRDWQFGCTLIITCHDFYPLTLSSPSKSTPNTPKISLQKSKKFYRFLIQQSSCRISSLRLVFQPRSRLLLHWCPEGFMMHIGSRSDPMKCWNRKCAEILRTQSLLMTCSRYLWQSMLQKDWTLKLTLQPTLRVFFQIYQAKMSWRKS